MKANGRVAAAIEVLAYLNERHDPASVALGAWGRAHRYAGSADRAAIGNLVYDTLRNQSAAAQHMEDDSPRACVLGTLLQVWELDGQGIEALFDGGRYAPAALSVHERRCIERPVSAGQVPADPVAANIPPWLWPSFRRAFGETAGRQGQALAQRAPVDLRVNTLKADRQRLMGALARFSPVRTPLSPLGVRFAPASGWRRPPAIAPEPALKRGWAQVQDEGSQLAALLCDARSGQQVFDYCAGAGGKTLALAAMMENRGQIFAADVDRHRLAAIFERLRVAATRNVQVLAVGDGASRRSLRARMDIVVADVPCSGSGAWRRNPQGKWRLRPEHLKQRLKEQQEILDNACLYVKTDGVLLYITCSLLCEENEDQISAFLARRNDFELQSLRQRWQAVCPETPMPCSEQMPAAIRLSPWQTHTDGFFIASLRRRRAGVEQHRGT